jgi:phage tail tape-measure protein
MSFGFDDIFSGSALSGMASGAAGGATLGSAVPGIGTAIGAIGGGLLGGALGAYANEKRDQGNKAQLSALDKFMLEMKQAGQSSYDQHINDLKQVQSLYAVPQQQWNNLYGNGQAAQTGQGNWAGTGMQQAATQTPTSMWK